MSDVKRHFFLSVCFVPITSFLAFEVPSRFCSVLLPLYSSVFVVSFFPPSLHVPFVSRCPVCEQQRDYDPVLIACNLTERKYCNICQQESKDTAKFNRLRGPGGSWLAQLWGRHTLIMALPLRFYSFTDGGFLNEAHGWLDPVQKELCDIDFDTEIDGIDLWCTWRTKQLFQHFLYKISFWKGAGVVQ